ncbi:MAG: helix-turn-helix domain-containing protein [Actinomycetota bacterium]
MAGESRATTESQDQPAQKVCPHFHAAIELIGKRWSGAIISAMAGGPRRFGELCESVPGVSDRLLSQRLRELEAAGVVERTVEGGAPVRVSYSLTEKGAELQPALRELHDWAKRWDYPPTD